MYGSGFEQDLRDMIGSKNLEKRFGGDLDNKEDNFWPPQLD